MIKNFIGFLINGNVSREDYMTAKEDMYHNNVLMLRVLSSVATIIFVACTILGVVVPNMRSKIDIYVVGVVLSLTILLIAQYSKNRTLHKICMCLLDVMLLSVGLLITLVSAPEQLTVTLIPVALLVPLFFDVKPVVFLVVVGAADIIYLVFAPFVKPSDILTLDIVDVLAFSAAGIVIGAVITKVKIERYAYANKIKRIALQDGLTECFNRKAYYEDIHNLSKEYPDDFVFVSLDVNGLKVVNDSLGHEAGDEIILGASHCMLKSFGKFGKIYRIGGDEFIVVMYIGNEKLENVINEFKGEIANWHGQMVDSLSVSYGYVEAKESQGLDMKAVAAIADKRMYEEKRAFYREKGIEDVRKGQSYEKLFQS